LIHKAATVVAQHVAPKRGKMLQPLRVWLPCRGTICLAPIVLLLSGCAPPESTESARIETKTSTATVDQESLVQFSLLAALAADDYVGGPRLDDVLANGDFGIGTFDRLDGEMIVLDGKIYQALSDGTVRPADLNGTTPFAAVTFFSEDGQLADLKAASLKDLETQLDRKLPRHNSPYAIRVTSELTQVTVRSVPAQSPPFRPLVEVVKDQPTWEHQNVHGTLVGLRCPHWMGTINVSGYHWHFLSDDHKIGGHVLACAFDKAAASFDECTSVTIRLPQSAEFDRFDANEVTEEDIKKIERQRTPTN